VAIDLSQPPRRHLLKLADAFLVCEDDQTLAGLQCQLVTAPDASNLADFLRISPWQADERRAALRRYQGQWLLAAAPQSGVEKVIHLNLDDSLGGKDQATPHLAPVDWHHDHNESTKTKPRYKNAFCYLAWTMRSGEAVATVDLRLYLRAKTVRRLNRQRTSGQPLAFRSQSRIARAMLVALRPLLPHGWTVYGQFDSWYASAR
jgi:hypothetical protein